RWCVPGFFVAATCRNNAMLGRLELVIQTRRDADEVAAAPCGWSRAAVIREHGIRTIVAIRRETAAAGTDVIVSIAIVDGVCRIQVPVQTLVEAMLPRNGVHVGRIDDSGRIVVVLAARISRRITGMRPADADVIPAEN